MENVVWTIPVVWARFIFILFNSINLLFYCYSVQVSAMVHILSLSFSVVSVNIKLLILFTRF